ncbi:hypothetical protein EH223_19325 [candidate division KSB1 bacterium]|nr:hypothetical protein [candidate division KSB1 bacterium]RQW00101.1 MAG: hypothetical protein EH223_19325 [candidate division KSB1 bacterium]
MLVDFINKPLIPGAQVLKSVRVLFRPLKQTWLPMVFNELITDPVIKLSFILHNITRHDRFIATDDEQSTTSAVSSPIDVQEMWHSQLYRPDDHQAGRRQNRPPVAPEQISSGHKRSTQDRYAVPPSLSRAMPATKQIVHSMHDLYLSPVPDNDAMNDIVGTSVSALVEKSLFRASKKNRQRVTEKPGFAGKTEAPDFTGVSPKTQETSVLEDVRQPYSSFDKTSFFKADSAEEESAPKDIGLDVDVLKFKNKVDNYARTLRKQIFTSDDASHFGDKRSEKQPLSEAHPGATGFFGMRLRHGAEQLSRILQNNLSSNDIRGAQSPIQQQKTDISESLTKLEIKDNTAQIANNEPDFLKVLDKIADQLELELLRFYGTSGR